MDDGSTVTEEGAADVAVLDVSGVDCASCVAHVTKAATSVEGGKKAEVNLARGRAVVEFDGGKVRPEVIAAAITESGYPAAARAEEHDAAAAERERIDRQRE